MHKGNYETINLRSRIGPGICATTVASPGCKSAAPRFRSRSLRPMFLCRMERSRREENLNGALYAARDRTAQDGTARDRTDDLHDCRSSLFRRSSQILSFRPFDPAFCRMPRFRCRSLRSAFISRSSCAVWRATGWVNHRQSSCHCNGVHGRNRNQC